MFSVVNINSFDEIKLVDLLYVRKAKASINCRDERVSFFKSNRKRSHSGHAKSTLIRLNIWLINLHRINNCGFLSYNLHVNCHGTCRYLLHSWLQPQPGRPITLLRNSTFYIPIEILNSSLQIIAFFAACRMNWIRSVRNHSWITHSQKLRISDRFFSRVFQNVWRERF